MPQRSWLAAVLTLCLLTVPAFGQVQLDWKLKEGDKFYLETVSTFHQNMKVLGKEVKQDLEMTTLFSVAVLKKEANGSTTLEQKLEALAVRNLGGPTGNIPAEDKFNQQLRGMTFTLTVTPRGEVTKFEGYEALVKKLAGDDAAAQKTVRAALTEDYLKNSATEAFVLLPAAPVKPGDSWGGERKVETSLGPLGHLSATRKFTYEGKETMGGKSLDKITFAIASTYVPAKQGEAGAFPFQTTKSDLKVEDHNGKVYFDAAAGRLVQSEVTMRLKGSATIVANGNTLETEIQQDQTLKTRLLDQLPEPPK